ASVRYDSSLPQGAKILYGEISARTNQRGYCWTSNARFVTLYGVSERTINYWIAALHNAGHIVISYEYYGNSKKIKERRITLPLPIAKVVEKLPLSEPPPGGPEGENNTQQLVVQKIAPPDSATDRTGTKPLPEGGNDTTSSGAKICSTKNLVVQKIAPPGGAKNCGDNIKVPNTAAAAAYLPKDIKAAFDGAGAELVFQDRVYQKAASYMTENQLDLSYAAFILGITRKKKPDDLRALFLTLFFAPDLAELFKASRKPPPEPVQERCPACGASHDAGDAECPSCGLERGASEKDVRIRRHLLSLPREQRGRYEETVRLIIAGGGFLEQRQRLDALHRELGFPE
ncbi:MAG: helix-turn-helix domain-containing protein, partial [Spirochaetaceae bacterium]|nr:helix-turn-helix domain-containing protein [Spirochaetaceae bacterium]